MFDLMLLFVAVVLLVMSLKVKGELKNDGRIFTLMCGLMVLRGAVGLAGPVAGMNTEQVVLLSRFFTGCAAGAFLALVVNGGWRRLTARKR